MIHGGWISRKELLMGSRVEGRGTHMGFGCLDIDKQIARINAKKKKAKRYRVLSNGDNEDKRKAGFRGKNDALRFDIKRAKKWG